jgi:rhodanese-related sulfurtransferase
MQSPEEVQKMMQANPDMIYWDVRSDDEYAKARIPDSANCAAFVISEEGPMPMQSTFMTLMKMQNPDKSAPIVVGCASGKRSSVACAWLEAEGFDNIVELESGFNGWYAPTPEARPCPQPAAARRPPVLTARVRPTARREAAGLPVEKD